MIFIGPLQLEMFYESVIHPGNSCDPHKSPFLTLNLLHSHYNVKKAVVLKILKYSNSSGNLFNLFFLMHLLSLPIFCYHPSGLQPSQYNCLRLQCCLDAELIKATRVGCCWMLYITICKTASNILPVLGHMVLLAAAKSSARIS